MPLGNGEEVDSIILANVVIILATEYGEKVAGRGNTPRISH